MALTVLMSLEGVLAGEPVGGDSLSYSQEIPEGILLFHALHQGFNIVLSSVEDDKTARWWLRHVNIKPSDWARLLVGTDQDHSALAVRARHIVACRSGGYDLRYVIDADPSVARLALSMGISPLCCPHPVYARTSFLPDSGSGGRAWDEIEADMRDQRLTRAADLRTEVDDTAIEAEDEEVSWGR